MKGKRIPVWRKDQKLMRLSDLDKPKPKLVLTLRTGTKTAYVTARWEKRISIPDPEKTQEPGAHGRRAATLTGKAATVARKSRAT